MVKLKKNQLNNILTVMVDATDFATVESGLAADDINIRLYGVAQGSSTAASTITVSKAAGLVHSGLFQITLKAAETDAHDFYMLRLSSTSTVSCATQYIPLEMVDNDDSDIMSAITAVDSQLTVTDTAMDSQFAYVSDAISNVQSTLDSHIVIASDFMSNMESRVPKEVASKSLLSDVESNVRSQFAALSNDVSNIQSTLDSHIVIASDFMSNVLSRVPKEVASKSLLSDVESNIRSQFAGLSNDVSNVQSTLDSHILVASDYHSDLQSRIALVGGASASDMASAVWAQLVSAHKGVAGSFGSQFSDIWSRAGGGAGLNVSDIASAVWAEKHRVHSLASSFGSAFSNLWTAANAARDNASDAHSMAQDIDSQLTATDAALVSASNIASNVWNDVLTAARYNTANSAGRRLRNIQDFGIYDLASVWVDEAAGTSTGTTDGEDATVTNRANDFDNAQTVANSVGLDRIHIQSGNSITLTATLNGYEIWGSMYTVALGGQNVGLTVFVHATISGIGTGTTPEFISCTIGNATISPSTFTDCKFTGTLTMGSAGAYRLIRCQSGVAGASSPTIDMGAAVGASTLELRDWRGGITLNNLAAGDVVTLDGIFGGITLNGADATVEIRGIYKSLTNNLTGSPTVNEAGIEGELTNATVATKVWSDYESAVGASPSQVYSQIQSMISNTYELVSDVESQLDATDAVVDSAYSAIQATDSQLTVTDAAINSRVNAQVVDVLRTDTIPDSYSTDGAQPTIAQAILAIHQFLHERSVSSTTVTVKKPDGSTTAQTFTLNDATSPTSITRAT